MPVTPAHITIPCAFGTPGCALDHSTDVLAEGALCDVSVALIENRNGPIEVNAGRMLPEGRAIVALTLPDPLTEMSPAVARRLAAGLLAAAELAEDGA